MGKVVSFTALILLASCSSGGSSSTYASSSDIQAELQTAGLGCQRLSPVEREDREWIQEDALDVATCLVDGEEVTLTIWKDNGQRNNYVGLGENLGCAMAEEFGISEIFLVVGNRWSVTDVSRTLAERLEDELGGRARSLC